MLLANLVMQRFQHIRNLSSSHIRVFEIAKTELTCGNTRLRKSAQKSRALHPLAMLPCRGEAGYPDEGVTRITGAIEVVQKEGELRWLAFCASIQGNRVLRRLTRCDVERLRNLNFETAQFRRAMEQMFHEFFACGNTSR